MSLTGDLIADLWHPKSLNFAKNIGFLFLLAKKV